MRPIDRVVQSLRRRRQAARVSSTARRVRQQSLSYLNFPELADIERCAREAPDGDFVECGIALGGSAILMASLLPGERVMHGYDVFGMIPPPGPEDPPKVHERYQVIASDRAPASAARPITAIGTTCMTRSSTTSPASASQWASA